MGEYAPVICFDTARRRAMARQLLALGVHRSRILATKTDAELADLWTRERTITSLRRLTGHGRAALDLLGTAELVHLEQRTVAHLMGAEGRTPDQLIYSISGRRPRNGRDRRRQDAREWGIPA